MSIKLLYLIIVFLFSFVAKCYSQQDDRWIYYGKSDDGKGEYYYDKESIVHIQDTASVWLKYIAIKDDFNEFEEKYIDKILWRMDLVCERRIYAIRETKYYYKDGSSTSTYSKSFQSILPENILENVYKSVCK